jgi:hypothetical protein
MPRNLKISLMILYFWNTLHFAEGVLKESCTQKASPESDSRATKLFQIVHSDLKEFPVESYSRYKYLISFLDDYSSHAWVALLRKKSETLTAFKHFVAMIRNQFKAEIEMLMSDFWERI